MKKILKIHKTIKAFTYYYYFLTFIIKIEKIFILLYKLLMYSFNTNEKFYLYITFVNIYSFYINIFH
jgi:hypothetical protein